MGIYLLLPALVLLAILIVYPLINSIIISFHSQLIYEQKGKFVGLQNYIDFLKDKEFWHSFLLSIEWTLANVVGQVVLGVIMSLFLNEQFKGRTIVRGLVLLPFFMPVVSIMLMWRWMLNDSYGIINYLFMSIGIIKEPISWLGSTQYAFPVVIFISIWRYFPFVIINVLAKLQTIPTELYEAARIDGANTFSEFWYVTLPQISDVLKIVVMLRIIFMFKKVDEIMMLTNGGPGSSTEVLPLFAYRNAFEAMQLGKGAASSIIVLIILMVLMAIYFTYSDQKELEA